MEQWKLNAEHVRRWTRSHQQRLQRLADDRKYERRQTSKHRIPINEFCAKLADKHRRRISTFQKQTCAELVAYAERNGCRKIIWEREDSGFLPSFPWYEFESLVEQQAALRGISFERAEKAAAQLTASN